MPARAKPSPARRRPTASPWPNGARCCVFLQFHFDAESGWLSRDPATADLPGVLSQGVYGAKMGVPRILDLLKAERVPSSWFIPGWVAERHPAAARAIRDTGVEIGHHGYLHERARPDDPTGERDAFARGMKALETILDIKPIGYSAPGWDLTPITLDLVREHGMIYSTNLMDDAYPYLHPGSPPVVEIPVDWILDDAPYYAFHPKWLPRPMQSPESVYTVWRDEFLGCYELGGMFDLTCHPQFSGHPSRLLALRKLIRLIKGHRNVWWATGREIAELWLGREGAAR